jgi:hypothetical protein
VSLEKICRILERARPHGNASSKISRDTILEIKSHDVGHKPNARLTVRLSAVQDSRKLLDGRTHKMMLERRVLIEVI